MSGETRCQRCGLTESAPAHYYFDPDEGEFNGFHAFVPATPIHPDHTEDTVSKDKMPAWMREANEAMRRDVLGEPRPMPAATPSDGEPRFATTLTDEQIDDECRDISNPARFDLWSALATAAYARRLADDPRLSDADSSWLMATRDAIYWLAEKWLTSLRSTPDRAEADDAALGKALREALATVPDGCALKIRALDYSIGVQHWDGHFESADDATRHLTSLLSRAAQPATEEG